jgi:hypothetical protein
MVLSNSGVNNIIIGTDSYYDLELSNKIVIRNQQSKIEKEMNIDNLSNERFIKWEFTNVIDINDEDLSLNKIYLNRGFYDVFIYNNNELIYQNILFVNIEYTKNNIVDDGDSFINVVDD